MFVNSTSLKEDKKYVNNDRNIVMFCENKQKKTFVQTKCLKNVRKIW